MLALEAFDAALAGKVEQATNLADRAARQPNAHYRIFAIAAFCNSISAHDLSVSLAASQ